ALVLSRARSRRRYGTDMPEVSTPSRFLDEIPSRLLEDIGSPRVSKARFQDDAEHFGDRHYSYEDEDQSFTTRYAQAKQKTRNGYSGPKYNSIDNISEFFAARGKKFSRPQIPVEEAKGKSAFRPGQKVKHPKYGEGIVYQR